LESSFVLRNDDHFCVERTAQLAFALMSVFVRPHDRHGAEPTANSDSCPSAVTAAEACCRLKPV